MKTMTMVLSAFGLFWGGCTSETEKKEETFQWASADTAQKLKHINEHLENPAQLKQDAHKLIHSGEFKFEEAMMAEMMGAMLMEEQISIYQAASTDPDPKVKAAAGKLKEALEKEMTQFSRDIRVIMFDPKVKDKTATNLYTFCQTNTNIEKCDAPKEPYDVIEVQLLKEEGKEEFLTELKKLSLSTFRYRKVNFTLDGKTTTEEFENIPPDNDFIHVKW